MVLDVALRPLKNIRILISHQIILFFVIHNFWLEHHFKMLLVTLLPGSHLEAFCGIKPFEGPEEQHVARNITLNRRDFEF